jgi:acetoin utilization deacetylase AcuC-like enzyme
VTCLLLHHPDCLLHTPPRPHPEKPERVEAVRARLQEEELWDRLPREEPDPAPRELLELVHPAEYLSRVERASRAPGVWLDPDTYAVEGTWRAVVAAAGAAVGGVDAVVRGRAPCAFALVRPPGHHAGPQRAMGFCLVNHAAVAVRYATEHLGLSRVMVVDWDVHHGNGTQEVFYRDGKVLFASLHQEGWYPGTGALEETGEGEGEGLTVNVPLPPGVGDEGYATVFEDLLLPLGDLWKPDLVVVSAGFDAHHSDPLGEDAAVGGGVRAAGRPPAGGRGEVVRRAGGSGAGGRLRSAGVEPVRGSHPEDRGRAGDAPGVPQAARGAVRGGAGTGPESSPRLVAVLGPVSFRLAPGVGARV